PFENLPLQIAGGARCAAKIFEPVVMRLQVVGGGAIILERHGFGEKFPALSVCQMGLEDKIGRQEAECLGVPVDASAADASHRHECAPSANRQRLLVHLVAKG